MRRQFMNVYVISRSVSHVEWSRRNNHHHKKKENWNQKWIEIFVDGDAIGNFAQFLQWSKKQKNKNNIITDSVNHMNVNSVCIFFVFFFFLLIRKLKNYHDFSFSNSPFKQQKYIFLIFSSPVYTTGRTFTGFTVIVSHHPQKKLFTRIN